METKSHARQLVGVVVVDEDGSVALVSEDFRALFPDVGPTQELVGQSFTRLLERVARVSERPAVERLGSDLVSMVSHELRSPLTAIHGSLRLIEGGVSGPISEEGLKLVRVASSSTERLVRLLNDVLDLQKMEDGHLLTLTPREVSTVELLRRSVDGIEGMAREVGVQVQLETDGLPPVHVDDDRMVQVFTNLLSNAVKYSPAGGTVRVHALPAAEGRLRLAVSDEGPGIAEGELPRLFRRFQQLDATDGRRKPGTGLGLAISKAIVEQHGGAIGVDSAPGRGSTFWVELPALR
ncbi:MAG: HAMP domain-containing histidine kinase [Myxococcaceae bacterium]|nr:HAMP domain-containing histidine kinase [Myxococcaceae bacterium]MCI0672692.1 HAMP domain-containing histidine kinase [Myxococcaceae bacterium]